MKILYKLLLLISFASVLSANANQPVFDIVDTNNQHIKIKGTENGLEVVGAKGKVIFLEFFGHRCPPCLKTIPHLIDITNKYKDKVEILAIEVQGLSHTQLQAFAKQKGVNYHMISDEKAGMFTNYIAQRTQWQGGIPFMLILDTKGDAQVIHVGMIPQHVLENVIDKLTTQKIKK